MTHGPHGLANCGFDGCSYVPVGGYQEILTLVISACVVVVCDVKVLHAMARYQDILMLVCCACYSC